jgi:uncharacterized NAD(P)/FAD-binding protein YdhS
MPNESPILNAMPFGSPGYTAPAEQMRIAVIGGGAAAVGLLDSLLARSDRFRQPHIVIYEPSHLAHGLAFAPDLDTALINLPNGRMSIRSHEPAHFLNWLESASRTAIAGDDGPPAESYAPRWLFGEYLAEQLRLGLGRARDLGWRVEIVPEPVISTTDGTEGTIIVRSATTVRKFTHAILGIGPGSTADPYRLSGAPNYFADPYPLYSVLPDVAPSAHVLIIGTGLTAVDVTLGLLQLGHQGPITMASRNGILPCPRSPAMPLDLEYLTLETVRFLGARDQPLSLREVWDLLGKELASAGFDANEEISWHCPGRSARDRLRHFLVASDPIQSVYSAINSTQIPVLIRAALSAEAMRHVAVTYKPQLKSIQCPMPPSTARTLLAAMDSGQLVVESGLSDVSHRSGIFAVCAASAVPDAHSVIDATRVSPRRTRGRARQLIHSLSREGRATWDPFDGLMVDPRTGGVLSSSRARLYAIGEITAGGIYYASSLPAVTRGADLVAEELARHAQREPVLKCRPAPRDIRRSSFWSRGPT